MLGQEFDFRLQSAFIENKLNSKHFDKFAKKYRIWQVICSCGLRSQAYVISGTLKSDEYIKECLKKIFLKLIRQHSFSSLFWPDFASIHHSHGTFSWYEANKVTFVEKITLRQIHPNFVQSNATGLC
jgi:hypothetical protein